MAAIPSQGLESRSDERNPFTLTWDDFPSLVQLHVLQFLDRRAINYLRQISDSARCLIENVFGLHAIVPSRNRSTNWRYMFSIGIDPDLTRQVTTEEMRYILNQMEGKFIHTLELWDTPFDLGRFPFDRFIQYPRLIRHVKLINRDVTILHSVFSKCSRLKTLKYERGYEDIPEVAPMPTCNEAIMASLPQTSYSLTCLKKLDLCCYYHLDFVIGCDWGAVAYLLVALPVLPSLSTFIIKFYDALRANAKMHLLCSACFWDFLAKTPNLETLVYTSAIFPEIYGNVEINSRTWRAIIQKFGSPWLKQVEESYDTLSFSLVEPIIVSVARTLTHLSDLTIILTEINETENTAIATFLCHLSTPTQLGVYCGMLTNLTQQPVERDALKISDIFSLIPVENGYVPRLPTQPSYQNLTILSFTFNFSPGTVLSLNKIVNNCPKLLVLSVFQGKSGNGPVFCHFDENPTNGSPFTNLLSLTLRRLSIGDLTSPTSSIIGLLLQCRNLSVLDIKYSDDSLWYNHVNRGIHVTDLFQILASMPKLNAIRLDKIYFYLSSPLFWTLHLDVGDASKRAFLRRAGGFFNFCQTPRRRIMPVGAVFQNVVDANFHMGNMLEY